MQSPKSTPAPSSLCFCLIMALCAFLRFYKLGEIPTGINQDEAMTGYEALTLLKNGTDSWGYPRPFYFMG